MFFRSIYGLAAVIVISTLFQGCSFKRHALTPEMAAAITAGTTYNVVVQDEIMPSIASSKVLGSLLLAGQTGIAPLTMGVVFDLKVNKSRHKQNQDIMDEFYNYTDDFDYREVLGKNLRASLESVLPITIKDAPTEFLLLSDKEKEARINSLATGEVLVYTSSFYRFMKQHKIIVAETQVSIFAKPKRTRKTKQGNAPPRVPKPIFNKNYYSISESHGAGGEDSLVLWAQNNGQLYRETMEVSAKRIGDMITHDIQAKTVKYCGKPVKAYTVNENGIAWINTNVVKDKDDWIMLQDKHGALHALSKQSIQYDLRPKPPKCR